MAIIVLCEAVIHRVGRQEEAMHFRQPITGAWAMDPLGFFDASMTDEIKKNVNRATGMMYS